MPVTDAYATAAEYRARLNRTDASKDADISIDLAAVSRYIDSEVHRFFTKDASDVTRTFVANGGDTLMLGCDLVTVATIKLDENGDGSFGETALAGNDYELLPRNAALGSEPRPYRMVRLTPWGTKQTFGVGQLVEIVGTFGWPAVPGPIKLATIHLTSLVRLESDRAKSIAGEVGTLLRVNPEARQIIEDLRRTYGIPVVA